MADDNHPIRNGIIIGVCTTLISAITLSLLAIVNENARGLWWWVVGRFTGVYEIAAWWLCVLTALALCSIFCAAWIARLKRQAQGVSLASRRKLSPTPNERSVYEEYGESKDPPTINEDGHKVLEYYAKQDTLMLYDGQIERGLGMGRVRTNIVLKDLEKNGYLKVGAYDGNNEVWAYSLTDQATDHMKAHNMLKGS